MENREALSSKSVTLRMIVFFILYGIAFNFIYSIVYAMISAVLRGDNTVIKAIIAIALQTLTIFCVWRCSIATALSKKTIQKVNARKIMRNFIILTVVVCVISAITNFLGINAIIESTLKSDTELNISEAYVNMTYDEEQIEQYQEEKERQIRDLRVELYTYFAILEIGFIAVNIVAVVLQKKTLSKYAE